MQNVSAKYSAVKHFDFKNPRYRTTAILKIEKSGSVMMMQNGSLQPMGDQPSSIFEILTAMHFRDVLHHCAKF